MKSDQLTFTLPSFGDDWWKTWPRLQYQGWGKCIKHYLSWVFTLGFYPCKERRVEQLPQTAYRQEDARHFPHRNVNGQSVSMKLTLVFLKSPKEHLRVWTKRIAPCLEIWKKTRLWVPLNIKILYRLDRNQFGKKCFFFQPVEAP